MKKQQIESQKGEIEFRKKLYQQQIDKNNLFEDEFDANGIENILNSRMAKTRDQMVKLLKNEMTLTPYIEIGAERCQRSLVMENDLGLNGAAVDLSFDMLKSCDYYKKIFNKVKTPIRICCDANNLPFLSNSIPFAFCYETLHHFPEPTPITKEIYRVLSPGGFFFFDEEPYKQILHFDLYKGQKIYSKDSLNKNKIKKIIDHFFCSKICNEIEHGIIENHDLSLKAWKMSLQHFEENDVTFSSSNFFRSKLFNPTSKIKYFAGYLLGGSISGICRKSGHMNRIYESIYDTIICPSCREDRAEILLEKNEAFFMCQQCSKKYPVVDEVLFLFTDKKFSELYPEYSII